MADPVQPSFSTLARAVGGRYDPTTPRGQELLKQDILNEALRAEAQRAAKAAMEERKALQYIQQESARPSRQEASGVRSIFKDGRLVGYSTTPEINAMVSPIQKNPMGTALERGFISALKKADILKAARDAAEKAKASGKPMPQEVEETVTEKVVEKPAPMPAAPQEPVDARMAQVPLSRAMERLRNVTAPAAVASPQQKDQLAGIADLYRKLQTAQQALASGQREEELALMDGPNMTLRFDLSPQDRANIQQKVDTLTQQIREASAATKDFGVPAEQMQQYEALRRTMELLGLQPPV